MKKSEILRKAKRQLDDGKYGTVGGQKYICNAIKLVCGYYDCIDSPSQYEMVRSLTSWIQDDLMGMHDGCSLEQWLDRHYPTWMQTSERVQKLRHMWIDWMIQYWESKGE